MSNEPLEPVETLEPAKPEHVATEEKPGSREGISILGIAGIATFCALVVMVAGMAVYMKFIHMETRIATVNVSEIMEAKQMQLASMVMKKNTTDTERGAAYDLASKFGAELQGALKIAQQECGCIVLASGAVVSGESLDLTARVKEIVGLSGLNVEAMKRQFADEMRIVPKTAAGK